MRQNRRKATTDSFFLGLGRNSLRPFQFYPQLETKVVLPSRETFNPKGFFDLW